MRADPFPVWKLRFRHRDTFSEAARGCGSGACDIGWADMILAFDSAEKFDAAFAWLISEGISQFETEKFAHTPLYRTANDCSSRKRRIVAPPTSRVKMYRDSR